MIRGNAGIHESARAGRRAAVTVVMLVGMLLALAAGPSLASATTFEVNSLNDGTKTPAGAICEATFPGECTLRAAIEAANEAPAPDVITFSAAIFNGVVGADEIEPATVLPTITAPVSIVGRPLVVGTYVKPSVAVKAPVGAAGLKVESEGVVVQQVAFGGGDAGIEVLDGSTGFVAHGDWFGLRLDATAEPITGVGLLLGPGADGATVGADEFELTNRNVFTNSDIGIDIDGASDAKILGNYVGVGPEGKGPATLNSAVEISDHNLPPPLTLAEHNEIGGVLTPAEAVTPACDGACNVIVSNEGTGVYLEGMADETAEPTRIRGNVFGLEADGVTPVGPATNLYGVVVQATAGCGAGPANVNVGGAATTETNFIVGGSVGIYAEGAENFSAIGNAIGIGADGEASESPESAGIAVCAAGVTRTGHVIGNRMDLSPDTLGIESSYGRAEILGNSIEGSYKGILLNEESEGHGDLVAGNTITDPDTVGIEIENDSNVVTGNTITGAERDGIKIEGGNHNRIGGDGLGEENTIVGTGHGGTEEEAAITIAGLEIARNEVAANRGSANFGPFIQFFPQSGSERINGGIEPPIFATVLQSSATGSAVPNSTVRIFAKSESKAGELGPLLTKVVADGSGAWVATFPTQPVGTLVTATQTSNAGTAEAGTSALATASSATADPVKPEEPTGGGNGGTAGPGGNPSPQPPPSTQPLPAAKITAGPKKNSAATTAKFKFKADRATAKFECKLDGAKWAKCTSPKTYKKLKVGKHTFRVRATASGFTGAVAKYQFTVKA